MMKKWFLRFAVALILFLSLQGPELIGQYLDHLTGHVEELNIQVQKLQELTGKKGAELKPLINSWIEKGEPKEPSLFIFSLFERFEKLTADLQAFREAKFWTLPFTFLSHVEGQILRETLENYRWGLSITFSVIPFLLLGIVLSFLLYIPFRNG